MDYSSRKARQRLTPTEKQVRQYMATLGKLLDDYRFAGVVALGLVPDFLTESAALPQPYYAITFRSAGLACTRYGTYQMHSMYLATLGNIS